MRENWISINCIYVLLLLILLLLLCICRYFVPTYLHVPNVHMIGSADECIQDTWYTCIYKVPRYIYP